MKAARYHSLAAVKETIPETLKVAAKTKDGEVMVCIGSIPFTVYSSIQNPS